MFLNKNLIYTMKDKLKLHEAIAAVLSTRPNKTATTQEIADEINARKIYLRKDGTPLPAYQVKMRTMLSNGNYAHIFKYSEPDVVSLIGHL